MPIIGIIDSSKTNSLATDFFESIVSYNATTSTTSTVISNIPQVYKHLRVVISIAGNGNSNNLSIRPNSDITSNNYIIHRTYGSGTSNYAYTYNNVGGWFYNYTNSGVLKVASIVDIYEYSRNDIWKNYHSIGGNNSANVWNESGMWRSTAPITSLEITFQGTTGTRISVYGVK
jgi:hypothetical protein